jgi:hypothetical protein
LNMYSSRTHATRSEDSEQRKGMEIVGS